MNAAAWLLLAWLLAVAAAVMLVLAFGQAMP